MRRRKDRGQATLELALVLPLLLFLVAVLLHIGFALAVQLQLESAAREAARAAAVEPGHASARASDAAERVMDGRTVRVSTTVDSEWVTVTVEAAVDLVPFVGGRRTLEADAVMRREDLIR